MNLALGEPDMAVCGVWVEGGGWAVCLARPCDVFLSCMLLIDLHNNFKLFTLIEGAVVWTPS